MKIIFADKKIQAQIRKEWGDEQADHMHFENGFSLVAVSGKEIIGLISVYLKPLPYSLAEKTLEGYIDIIEVHKDHRRKGIATNLIGEAIKQLKKRGVLQLRSWSSQDKKTAIAFWKALKFGFHPADIISKDEEISGYFVTKVLD